MDAGYYTSDVAQSTTGQLVQTSLQQAGAQNKSSHNSNSGAIAAVVVLAVAVVLVSLYAVRLHMKLSQPAKNVVPADCEQLLPEVSVAVGCVIGAYTLCEV